MIQALPGVIATATSLAWLGLVICLLNLRKPIASLAENVSNAIKGKIELGPQRVNIEWERSIVTAAVDPHLAVVDADVGHARIPQEIRDRQQAIYLLVNSGMGAEQTHRVNSAWVGASAGEKRKAVGVGGQRQRTSARQIAGRMK